MLRVLRFVVLPQTARTLATDASKAANVRIRQASVKDRESFLQLASKEFVGSELLSEAMKGELTGIMRIVGELVDDCLKDKYSCGAYIDDKLVGFRVWHGSSRSDDFDTWIDVPDERAEVTINGLQRCKKRMWAALPSNINRLMIREIAVVDSSFRRHGIATKLAQFNSSDEYLKKEGFDGIASVATSLANQALLKKTDGYEVVVKVPVREVLVRRDGSVPSLVGPASNENIICFLRKFV